MGLYRDLIFRSSQGSGSGVLMVSRCMYMSLWSTELHFVGFFLQGSRGIGAGF